MGCSALGIRSKCTRIEVEKAVIDLIACNNSSRGSNVSCLAPRSPSDHPSQDSSICESELLLIPQVVGIECVVIFGDFIMFCFF